MHLTNQRARQFSVGVWWIGLGILLYTRMWWPGILFLIGAGSIVQGLVEGRGWYAFQGGIWLIAIGFWAIYDFNIALFFVALGISMVVMAFVRPPGFAKPKPIADHSMD
jgi:hypothetical protein